MDNTKHIKEDSFKNFNRLNYKESELEKVLGPYYNNIMNHKMKDKDTSNKINPTNGLWNISSIYKTTNQDMKADSLNDPYIIKEFNIKRNPYKTWEEEIQKFKNMGKKNKVEEELKKKKGQ